jgi:hypothetical protein
MILSITSESAIGQYVCGAVIVWSKVIIAIACYEYATQNEEHLNLLANS